MKTIIIAVQKIKNLLNKTINNQKGIVLPILLMALGGLSLLGAAAISVSSGEMSISHNDRNYKTAFNLAEAGINDTVDGIGGNRDLLPRPLGAITSASYSFSVGGSAFSNTGRYNVVVSIPVVTTVTADIALNASTVVVQSPVGLSVGNTIIVGNATSHYMTTIGAIDTSNNTLTLMDSQGRPYSFKEAFSANSTWVALNLLRVTSTGQAGLGLAGTGNLPSTVAGWRVVNTINSTPNPTLTTPTGSVRSIVTLQGEYTLQEIAVFDSFQAQVNSPGNTFRGPILVTTDLTVSPYTQGNYTGPIFNATNPTNANAIRFQDAGGTTITNTSILPKIINVPGASGKVNLNTILANAASNAQCYQQQCTNASGTQQIYYLNGYQVDVQVFKPQTPKSASFPVSISDDYYYDGTYLYVNLVVDTTFTPGSNDNVTVNLNTTTSPTSGNMGSAGNVNQADVTLMSVTPANAGVTQTGGNITFDNSHTYTTGTVITIRVAMANLTSGTYLRLYDNSSNMPGLGGSEAWTNGIWVNNMGGAESQAKQGDVTVLADSGAGTHPNHHTILTTAPATSYRGLYATSDTASSTAAGWTTTGEGALLFGGRKKNSAAWVVGDVAKYYTSYFIHTNAVGSCDDHDIEIQSYTKVTYLGTSTKCSDVDTKKLFLYETIWNMTTTNNLDQGVQPDDTDVKLGYVPHKGYFKWVRSVDSNDAELMKGVEVLLGDKEFNSVFNHSASSRFTSAVVNTNISRIRMIGWANPPTVYNTITSSIEASTSSFATWKMPSNSKDWDWPDMVGNRSQFTTTPSANGFDFSGFSTTLNSFNSTAGYMEGYMINGSPTFPNMADINAVTKTTAFTGLGNVNLYKTSTPWPGTWTGNGTKAMPGSPLMDPNGLSTTVITATISGPSFTTFEIRRGSANLFFNAANGIPFNIKSLSIETRGAGASITMGTPANPATVFAGSFKLQSEDCGGTINFSFTGKMVAKNVEFENNVQYNIDTTLGGGASCLSPQTASFIYLRKNSWKELRN